MHIPGTDDLLDLERTCNALTVLGNVKSNAPPLRPGGQTLMQQNQVSR